MGRLEEIEKRKSLGLFREDETWLISEVNRLRAAIEKHKKHSWHTADPELDSVITKINQELYKALEERK